MSFPWPYINEGKTLSVIDQRCPHLAKSGTRLIVHMFDILDDDEEVKEQIAQLYIEQNLALIGTNLQVEVIEKSIHKCAYHPVRPKVFWVVEIK